MSNSYDYGDQVICQGVFTSASTGAAVDPTDVYFQIKDPSGNITSYHYGVDLEVARLAVGRYTATVNVDEHGLWYYRWYSTGTGTAAGENVFNAKSSEFD